MNQKEEVLGIIRSHIDQELCMADNSESKIDRECRLIEKWIAEYVYYQVKKSNHDPIDLVYLIYIKFIKFTMAIEDNPICYFYAILANEIEHIGLLLV